MIKTAWMLILLLPLYGIAQQAGMNQLDERGRRVGNWQGTHDDGSLRYTGQFRNDRPYGEFRHYYPSGNLQAINAYSQNGRVAHNQVFFESGKLMAEGKYVNQQKDSTWRYYSEPDGGLLSVEEYHEGKLHGEVRNYFAQTGKLAERAHYQNGLREGPWEKFFPNGQPMVQGHYTHDLLDGELTIYYPDGTVQTAGQYDMGQQSGEWKHYDENGNLIQEPEHDVLMKY